MLSESPIQCGDGGAIAVGKPRLSTAVIERECKQSGEKRCILVPSSRGRVSATSFDSSVRHRKRGYGLW